MYALEDAPVDFELHQRPWGVYKTTVLQEHYQSKVIHVNPESRLSLQYHLRRDEHWTVAGGEGVAQIGESMVLMRPGATFFIPKGCKHRMTNTSEENFLIVSEVQIGDYFGEDDIIRIDDDYGRALRGGCDGIASNAYAASGNDVPAGTSFLTPASKTPSSEKPLVRIFLTDCDGCLTDAGMYYGESGEELKKIQYA